MKTIIDLYKNTAIATPCASKDVNDNVRKLTRQNNKYSKGSMLRRWLGLLFLLGASTAQAALNGYHEVGNCTSIAGWAWDSAQPNTAISVDIYDGSTLLTTAVAGIFRQDLLNAGLGNGYHGFSLLTPVALKNGQSHTITVKYAGTQTNLNTTPKTLLCTAPPGAPIIGNAVRGNAQATVSFTAPSFDGGSPITGYTVTSNPAGGVDTNAGTTSLNHLITGLVNGTAYTFTVTATNAVGTSVASSPSNSITPATVPDAPTQVIAIAGDSMAMVIFTAPANNGGLAIGGYTVTSSPAGGIDSNANSLGLNHIITGLTNGTAYTFTVTASNAVGSSSASLPSGSVTPTPAPAYYYIHTDQLDTPRQITDTAGNVVWQWDNSAPFGNNVPNENPSNLGAFHFNLRFPGQYFDGETNLNYNVNRDYDAATGRYIQSDPIGLGGGVNTFGYVGGNPLSYTDRSGLFFTSVDAACAQDPSFCAELMGQVQQNNADMARAQGNCDSADSLQASANALGNIGTTLGVAQLAHAVAGIASSIKNVGDHIVLGKSLGLEARAEAIGGTHLMAAENNWQDLVREAIANPGTMISVDIAHLEGTGSVVSRVMAAIQRDARGVGSPFDWELSQLYQAGRMATVNFFEDAHAIHNPFK